MKNGIDCILIGFKDYEINARVMAAKHCVAAYNNCKYQFIRYNAKKYYYDQFLNLLVSPNKKNISINELPYYGINYLFYFLKKKKLTVEYFNYFDWSINEIIELVTVNEVKTVAISSVYYTDPYPLIYLVKFFRKYAPSTKIIIGGAYIYNRYLSKKEDFLQELDLIGADFVICESQGEDALSKLVSMIAKGDDNYEKINNIYFQKDGSYWKTRFIRENNPLENWYVDWSVFDKGKLGKTINLRTSRGCMYNCSFCNYPIRNNPYSSDSVDNVIMQLKQLSFAKNIVFIDDSFNVPLKRFKNICSRIIAEDINIEWFSYFRLNCCDEESVKLMARSGCRGVFLGIESGSNTVLKNMNKHTTVELYRKGVELLRKYGILTFAYLLVGFPGETFETVKETVNFINESKINYYSFNLWYAEPETPIYSKCNNYELTGCGFKWKHYTMDAEEASNKMGYMFNNISPDTIYIPGENFSFWGVPYLLGKGYALNDINSILRKLQKYVSQEKEIENETIIDIQKILKGGRNESL